MVHHTGHDFHRRRKCSPRGAWIWSWARAATQQINQAYAVLLAAQFQGFCRNLHLECADHLVVTVTDRALRETLRDNLVFNRRLDRGNPNPGNIGSDFNRLNLVFWSLVDAHRPENPARRAALEELKNWRNAIAHQDFSPAMVRAGRPHLTLARERAWRKVCNELVRSFDEVLWEHLRICQLILEQVDGTLEQGYTGQFAIQGPVS